nr:hypothetical protein BaRGS_033928 [Batillaria attramentaria]
MTRKRIKFQAFDIHQDSSARLAASHEMIIHGFSGVLGGLSTWVFPLSQQGLTMTTAPRRDSTLKSDPELLTRTSWVNAALAYRQVKRSFSEYATFSEP